MANVIVAGVVALILGVSITYIVKAKKAGVKCVGCPAGGTCSGNCNGNCSGCHSDADV
ncbi:MAG: FeoB-associated Cys-rich membrane protein [Lachnospiraceae bacterium]|nr:FeoB-associated Cys-rich membrane protein [Lachnospiraceae bacterium]